jgi:hypothetical protein
VQRNVEVSARIQIRLLCINKRQQTCQLRNNKSNQTMNHLLHQISWHQYLIVALLAAIIYYLVVILRYYRPELQKLQRRVIGDKPGEQVQALQYQPAEAEAPSAPVPNPGKRPYPEDIISNVDFLVGELKACITRAADKPFAPAVLIPQLKQILLEYQSTAVSERPAINHLIVDECEKTGAALLTEEEVDQWWER